MVFSVESGGRVKRWVNCSHELNCSATQFGPDEASDRGRYLMIGAAEHGFVDTGVIWRSSAKAICSVDVLPAVVRILAAPSTPIHSSVTLRSCILVSRWSIWSTVSGAMPE
ncbi:hypothetical protein ACNKHV_06885 [Shigella flexneri]